MWGLQNFEIILLSFFGFFFLIQMYYYWGVYCKIFFPNYTSHISIGEPVSIVICARNEAENLEKYLPLVCEQDYPNFEVIVVNDCSIDDTEEVLKRLSAKYKNLRYTFIKEDEKFSHGKKLALTVGIKSAKNEWLLLTDADCRPESNQWLSTMSQHFIDGNSIVLGYGGFETEKGFLNKFLRFDTFFIALQYMSYAIYGRPYMGVGRNLAYRKSLFLSNKGFASHARLNSGDDDLFINEVVRHNNVRVEYSIAAHTKSKAKDTFSKWVEQKQRHYTTFPKYKSIHKRILGIELLSRVGFYSLFITLLITSTFLWKIILGLFIFRTINQLIVFRKSLKQFGEKKLLLISLLYDLCIPFINFGIYSSNLFRPKNRWR